MRFSKPFIFLAVLFLCQCNIQAQDRCPDWVSAYLTGNEKQLDTLNKYYIGIGTSLKSQDEADLEAKKKFASVTSMKITSTMQQNLQESDAELKLETSSNTEAVVDARLNGILVCGRFLDSLKGEFFSLVMYGKDEYQRLLIEEMQREAELARTDAQLKRQKDSVEAALENKKKNDELLLKKENQLAETQGSSLDYQNELEEINRRKMEQALELEYAKLEEQHFAQKRRDLEEFLQSQTPSKVINMHNSQIRPGSTIEVKTGVFPFEFGSAYYALSFRPFELSAKADFNNKKFRYQELSLKIQVMPADESAFYKTAVALGAVSYADSIYHRSFASLKPKYSPFISCDVTLPDYACSVTSAYADLRKISFGVNSFILFSFLKDRFSLLGEATYFNDLAYSPSGKRFMLEGGVRLKGSDTFETTVTYENYRTVALAFLIIM